MTNVVKFISTRSFFQLGAELKREKYAPSVDTSTNRQLWIAFFITFVFFIWAVYALIKYQSVLPGWVVILGILLLFAPAGPLLTLILVYYSVGTMRDTALETDVTETVTVGEEPTPIGGEPGETISGAPKRHLRERPYRPYHTHSHTRRPTSRRGHTHSHSSFRPMGARDR